MDRSITIGIHGAIKAPGELLGLIVQAALSLASLYGVGTDRGTYPPQLAQFVKASMYSATSCRIGSERWSCGGMVGKSGRFFAGLAM